MSLYHQQNITRYTGIDKGNDTYKVNYRRDGAGRDSYIALNNGGLRSSFQFPEKQATNGRALFYGYERIENSPPATNKLMHYNSNGSGRDSYISLSNGGFYPAKTVAEYANNFVGNLRKN